MGILIINADDFGGNTLATERIAACFAARRITSATAMVYMPDSDRAADIARTRQLPLGLHLNLTQPFDHHAAPVNVRERQARAIAHLAGQRAARYTLNPLLLRLMRDCVADQLERFREQLGREPTHIDGHNHVHLCPTVMIALPRRAATRTAESRPLEARRPAALLRRARHSLIARLHPTTDLFFPIDPLVRHPSKDGIGALMSYAKHRSVEVMTHPDRDGDYELLMSDRWVCALAGHRLGSFDDLTDAPGAGGPESHSARRHQGTADGQGL